MSKEVAAFVCSHVFERKSPVLLVLRVEGDWQLLCGGTHADGEIPRVVGLTHLVDEDPSLRAVLDLPIEWEAERSSLASPWERRPIA
jgi:hypothetical protein